MEVMFLVDSYRGFIILIKHIYHINDWKHLRNEKFHNNHRALVEPINVKTQA